MKSSDVVAGQNAVFTDYNNLRADLVLGLNKVGSESYAATINIDFSDKTKGKIRRVPLTNNAILNPQNVEVGQVIFLRLEQPVAGGKTVTWWSNINWRYNVEPTLSSGASQVDLIGILVVEETSPGVFLYDGVVIERGLQ